MLKPVNSPEKQLEQILNRYQQLYTDQISRYNGNSALDASSSVERSEIVTTMIAAIERLAPRNTFYYSNLKNVVKTWSINRSDIIPPLVGIVTALKTAYENGYLSELEALVHADLFSDFIEMAEYLLSEGFKDPAAVMGGGVLEEHLRKMCILQEIEIEVNDHSKKAERMNTDLCNSGVYNKLDQKSVTAWLDLRNKAAHGKYSEFNDSQVSMMINGIREFVSRFPA